MSDVYRIDPDAIKKLGYRPEFERDELIRVGVLVKVEPDYEAATQYVKDLWLIDDRATVKLMSYVEGIVDAALEGDNEALDDENLRTWGTNDD